MKKISLLITIIFSLLLINKTIGLCETQYYLIDRGDNFKVLYLDSIVSEFELENIIRDIIEDKIEFYVREREYTIDVYIEKEYWITIRYNIQTGLKIIRGNITNVPSKKN